MARIFIGIFVVISGFLIVWQAEKILGTLGRVAWAEQHLGAEGGSRLFYKLIGVGFIFLGFFIISGIWNDLLNAFTSLFTPVR